MDAGVVFHGGRLESFSEFRSILVHDAAVSPMSECAQHHQRGGGNRRRVGNSFSSRALAGGVGPHRPFGGCFPGESERGVAWVERRKHRSLAPMGATSNPAVADGPGLLGVHRPALPKVTICQCPARPLVSARGAHTRVVTGALAGYIFESPTFPIELKNAIGEGADCDTRASALPGMLRARLRGFWEHLNITGR